MAFTINVMDYTKNKELINFWQGFCFYNNAAIAALHALGNVRRVVVLDWDVHHGNGIQNILEDNPAALYISLHRGNGFYPNTGHLPEVGEGPGRGFTVNIPWPKAGFGDADYMVSLSACQIVPRSGSSKIST